MERETARLLKNTAIWMILILITGGSIGLTERFFGKPASLIVGASILSGFMYWDFLKRKSAEDTTRQIFELSKDNRKNSLTTPPLGKTTDFKFQTSSVDYWFSISPQQKCHILFLMNFILISDSYEEIHHKIFKEIQSFIAEHPEYKDTILLHQNSLFNDIWDCSISCEADKLISKSQRLLIGNFLRSIEDKYLHSVETYLSFYDRYEDMIYYVRYMNGTAIESYIKDEENNIWGIQDVSDDEYFTLARFHKQLKSGMINITPSSLEEFALMKENAICEID